MQRISLAVAIFLCSTPILFAQGGGERSKEIDIEGKYTCIGDSNSGKQYRGTTTITKKNDVYVVTWTIGRESHEGTGIRNGETLSVVWRDDKGSIGVVVYSIRAKGKLEGKWTGLGDTKQYAENLLMDQ